jgi:ABC-type transport system involved in multi-copper enzyme maturation permease subunit
MIWRIAHRELAGNLLTLRFPLAAGLIVGLFLVNALVFVGADYRERTGAYAKQVAQAQEELRKRAGHLNELAIKGPGLLYKRPSPLTFVAGGHESALPIAVDASSRGGYGRASKNFRYNWTDPWALTYPYQLYKSNTLLRAFLEIDWAFIIGVVVSFVSIAFTYDAVCGEREAGTLRLTLSAPVPRDVVLLGKWAGAFLSVALPMVLGMALSLLVVLLSGQVELDADACVRVGLIGVFSLVYVALFVSVGLFVSARCRWSATGLLALLFVWVISVVLVPNTLGSVASGLEKIPSGNAFESQRGTAISERTRPAGLYDASPSESPPRREALERWARYLSDGVAIFTRITDAHLDSQFRQIEKARMLMRLSPAAVYQYAAEALAGTGFGRHRAFIEAARRHRDQVAEFIKAADRRDPESPHVYLVKEGLSSKPVNVQDIPPFVDRVSLGGAVVQMSLDAVILLTLCVLFFACAYFSFLRYDPR